MMWFKGKCENTACWVNLDTVQVIYDNGDHFNIPVDNKIITIKENYDKILWQLNNHL